MILKYENVVLQFITLKSAAFIHYFYRNATITFGDFARKIEIPPCKEHTPTTPHFTKKSANYKTFLFQC